MANQIGFRVEIGNLPENWEGTPQELLDRISELLTIAFEEDIAIFKTGTTQPNSLTNQAWLRDGKEWFVPDEDGNWVPVKVDDRLKFIYVRSTNPFTGSQADTPKERSLWLRTNTAGNEVRELSLYLDGEWRVLFTKSDFEALKTRVDSVIGPDGGLIDSIIDREELFGTGVIPATAFQDKTVSLERIDDLSANGVVTTNPDGRPAVFGPHPNRAFGWDVNNNRTTFTVPQITQYVLFLDRHAAGTDSIEYDAQGVWVKHQITLMQVNEVGAGITVQTSQMRLITGKWRCRIDGRNFYNNGGNSFAAQLRLRDVTHNATLGVSTPIHVNITSGAASRSEASALIVGEFDLSVAADLELQIRSDRNRIFHPAADMGEDEIYVVAEFWKIG